MKKATILILIITTLFACKNDNVSTESTQKNNATINANEIKLEIITSDDFNEDWSELISFETELKRVISKPINSEKDIELLLKLLNEIKKNYPEKFKTPAIEARIKVLETYISMFSLSLKEGAFDKNDEHILEIKKAHNNFVNKIRSHILKQQDYEKYK